MAKSNEITITLPEASMERLRAIQLKIEAPGLVDVLKNALRIYEALINHAEKGEQAFIRTKDGDISVLE